LKSPRRPDPSGPLAKTPKPLPLPPDTLPPTSESLPNFWEAPSRSRRSPPRLGEALSGFRGRLRRAPWPHALSRDPLALWRSPFSQSPEPLQLFRAYEPLKFGRHLPLRLRRAKDSGSLFRWFPSLGRRAESPRDRGKGRGRTSGGQTQRSERLRRWGEGLRKRGERLPLFRALYKLFRFICARRKPRARPFLYLVDLAGLWGVGLGATPAPGRPRYNFKSYR